MLYFSKLSAPHNSGVHEEDGGVIFAVDPWNREAKYVRQIVEDPPESREIELSKLRINREEHDSEKGPRWGAIISATHTIKRLNIPSSSLLAGSDRSD